MTLDPSLTVNQLGEANLLGLLQTYSPKGMNGDDGAILDPLPGHPVITTDVLVDEVHFSDQTTPAYAVGWRAATANLSDLAAMGSQAVALVIGLGLPGSTSVSWVKDLYQGLWDCCQPWQAQLVGGDLCRAKQRFVAITALGYVEPSRQILRNNALAGDWLVVTGSQGSSRAGLELLLNPALAATLSLSDSEKQSLIQSHQLPNPRLDVITLLHMRPPQRIAGMDTSDGLADALVQVCQMSGVNAVVDPEWIPMDPTLVKAFPREALSWALYGGEDFELLLSLEPPLAEWVLQQVPGSRWIGEVKADPDKVGQVECKGVGILEREKAFQHFFNMTY
jgi:thiamine-monophosphate kinase